MEEVYGVIGSPISHSMSPQMHNDLFQLYNISARYHAFHVEKESIKEAVKGMKALGIKGFNVTIPHKVSIIDFLDEIEEVARNIGAVNTVVNNNGKLIGYNTDGNGFIRSLYTVINKEELNQSNVLIIGAGGAARAIYISLAASGVINIDICNRSLERASALIDDCQYEVRSNPLTIQEAERNLNQYKVVINTTSVGMSPKISEIPIELQNLAPKTIVSDIIYNPIQTKLLQEANAKGAITQNGLGMFVNQGALAFEKWTGIFPDANRMEKNIANILGGPTC